MPSVQFDRFIDRDSPVHRLDSRRKLILALVFIVSVSTVPPGAWWAIGFFAAIVWTIVLASNIGPLRLLKRTFIALPFILVAVPSVFTRTGAGVFEVNMGLFTLTATDSGLEFVATLIAKSWLSVTAAALLVSTTRFDAIVWSLAWLKIPATLVAVFAGLYRYIHVLVEEALRLLRARDSRSASIPNVSHGGTLLWRASVTGHMAGSLFVRTLDRSERVYMAMAARGYDGIPLLPIAPRVGAMFILTTTLLAVPLLAVAAVSRFI